MVWWRKNFVRHFTGTNCHAYSEPFECSYKFKFNSCECRTNASPEENIEELKNDALAFLIVSLIESSILLFAGAICVDCFNHSAISQVTRMRVKYFTSLMRQDMGWFDMEKSKSNFAVRLDEYVSVARHCDVMYVKLQY